MCAPRNRGTLLLVERRPNLPVQCVKFWLRRAQDQRPLDRWQSRSRIPSRQTDACQEEVGLRVVRIKLARLQKETLGHRIIGLVEREHTQIAEGAGVARIKVERPLVEERCPAGIALLLPEGSE